MHRRWRLLGAIALGLLATAGLVAGTLQATSVDRESVSGCDLSPTASASYELRSAIGPVPGMVSTSAGYRLRSGLFNPATTIPVELSSFTVQ